jgi:hypothetical protein
MKIIKKFPRIFIGNFLYYTIQFTLFKGYLPCLASRNIFSLGKMYISTRRF